MDAFRAAVDETMREMEAEMKMRVRRRGQDTDRVTGNMAWAEFIHTTSRPVEGLPDPQLHAHVFAFNATSGTKNAAGRPASSATSKETPRISRRRFASGWRTGCRTWASACSENAMTSRSRAFRRTCSNAFPGAPLKSSRPPKTRASPIPNGRPSSGPRRARRRDAAMGWEKLRKEWNSRLSVDERRLLASRASPRKALRPTGESRSRFGRSRH